MNKSKKLYIKLFTSYSIAIIALAVILDFLLISSIVNNKKEEILYLNKVKIEDINSYINNQYNSGQLLYSMLYSSSEQLDDLISLLSKTTEDYVKYRLDKIYTSEDFTYKDDTFIKQAIEYNDNIECISLYSFSNNVINKFGKYSNIEMLNDFNINSHKDIQVEISNIVMEDLNRNNDEWYINTTKYINNPNTNTHIGVMVISYKAKDIDKIINKYDKGIENTIILDTYNEVIINKSNYSKNEIISYMEAFDKNPQLKEYNNKLINVVHSVNGITTLTITSKSEIFNNVFLKVINLQIIIILLVSIIEFYIFYRLQNLKNRLRNILDAMSEIENGNFNSKINIDKNNDEINIISTNFNNMCKRLQKYINRIYISELNEKEAEFIALQNKINPHFLYNTLEIIRMKAITDGNRDIGRMIYNLANLFRNIVKEKKVITIEQEINNCRAYLEIAKFRYGDNLTFNISCDEDILKNTILKFTLQPLVENFIIHGIDSDCEYNHIEITIKSNDKFIDIFIKDNGVGITKEKQLELRRDMNRIKHKLVGETRKQNNSIGIINVYERLIRFYGEDSGITILETGAKGSKLLIRILKSEESEDV